MSFSSGDNAEAKQPKPLGVDSKRLSTNEQARPIPYFAGKQRLAVTFISEVFDIKKAAVTRDIGKQKTRTGTSYFFSFAALIAHGPIDGIHAIILNSETVWAGNLVRDVSNPDFVDLTIPDYGLLRIYWGTETQTRDAYLYNVAGGYYGTSPQHPPYRGIGYIVAHQLFAGFNQSNIQNLEVIVSRYPVLTTGIATSPEVVGIGANPINVLYELLTNPRLGRGLQVEELNTAAIVDLGIQVWNETIGISPIIDQQVAAIEAINDVLEYIDGYPVLTDGLLSFALSRPVTDQSGLPLVDESLMIDPLRVSPEDWTSTFNEVNVTFTNPLQAYDADVRTWRDRGNFAITGDLNSQTVERLWATSPALAEFMATAIGRMRALPEAKGSLKLRMTALFDSLAPGELFKLNYPPRGYTNLVCKVLERILPDPARPVYELKFQIDRSYLLNGLAVGTDPIPGEPVITAASAPAFFKVVELPVELSPNGEPSVSVLMRRQESLTAGYKTLLGANYDFSGLITATTYDVIDSHDGFALHGLLQSSYPATEPLMGGGFVVELFGPDLEIEEANVFSGLSNELLVFVGNEIMSVTGASLLALNRYSLSVVRARFGTQMESHAVDAEVFIVRRDELQVLQHPHFKPGNTVALKLQAFTGQAVSSYVPTSILLSGRVYSLPPLVNLAVNGSSIAVTYSTGATIAVTWTATDGGALPTRSDVLIREVVLEFWNAAGSTLLGTILTPGGSRTLTNAELIATLGSEVSFLLKAKLRTTRDFWMTETSSVNLSVTKI